MKAEGSFVHAGQEQARRGLRLVYFLQQISDMSNPSPNVVIESIPHPYHLCLYFTIRLL